MLTLFFTANIQGSDQCWKKLLNAAGVFKADVLIVGGNLLGKSLHPIIRDRGDRWYTKLHGADIYVQGRNRIAILEEKIRTMGNYPCRLDREEWHHFQKSTIDREERFAKLAGQSLFSWLEWAEAKLKGTRHRLLLTPGNANPPFVEAMVHEAQSAEYGSGKTISFNAGCTLISDRPFLGEYGKSPVPATEEEIFQSLQEQAGGIDEAYSTVFSFQAPPPDSLPCRASNPSGDYQPAAPGLLTSQKHCRAVRRFIETYQPMLSLHGYTNDQQNRFTHIGRTLCCTPGNTSFEGLLSGFLVLLNNGRITDFQPIQG